MPNRLIEQQHEVAVVEDIEGREESKHDDRSYVVSCEGRQGSVVVSNVHTRNYFTLNINLFF